MAQECSGNPPFGELHPGQQILSWRQEQLAKGGQSSDLDWLLDLGGGLRWRFGGAPKATVAKATVSESVQPVAPSPSQQPAVKGLW